MQFHRDKSAGINIVTGIAADGVRVGETLITPPFIVAVDTVIPDWSAGDAGSLRAEDLQPAVELDPELIVLGSGRTLVFPPPAVIAAINRHGIGLETMDSAAACRTYNVLAHEGRKVALALLADLPSGDGGTQSKIDS